MFGFLKKLFCHKPEQPPCDEERKVEATDKPQEVLAPQPERIFPRKLNGGQFDLFVKMMRDIVSGKIPVDAERRRKATELLQSLPTVKKFLYSSYKMECEIYNAPAYVEHLDPKLSFITGVACPFRLLDLGIVFLQTPAIANNKPNFWVNWSLDPLDYDSRFPHILFSFGRTLKEQLPDLAKCSCNTLFVSVPKPEAPFHETIEDTIEANHRILDQKRQLGVKQSAESKEQAQAIHNQLAEASDMLDASLQKEHSAAESVREEAQYQTASPLPDSTHLSEGYAKDGPLSFKNSNAAYHLDPLGQNERQEAALNKAPPAVKEEQVLAVLHKQAQEADSSEQADSGDQSKDNELKQVDDQAQDQAQAQTQAKASTTGLRMYLPHDYLNQSAGKPSFPQNTNEEANGIEQAAAKQSPHVPKKLMDVPERTYGPAIPYELTGYDDSKDRHGQVGQDLYSGFNLGTPSQSQHADVVNKLSLHADVAQQIVSAEEKEAISPTSGLPTGNSDASNASAGTDGSAGSAGMGGSSGVGANPNLGAGSNHNRNSALKSDFAFELGPESQVNRTDRPEHKGLDVEDISELARVDDDNISTPLLPLIQIQELRLLVEQIFNITDRYSTLQAAGCSGYLLTSKLNAYLDPASREHKREWVECGSPQLAKESLAFEACHLAGILTMGADLGYIDTDEVLMIFSDIQEQLLQRFSSWEEFGDAIVQQLNKCNKDPESIQEILNAIEQLKKCEYSPWSEFINPWPIFGL